MMCSAKMACASPLYHAFVPFVPVAPLAHLAGGKMLNLMLTKVYVVSTWFSVRVGICCPHYLPHEHTVRPYSVAA